ncbi:MAG: ShlB/FhaC/HecB family hemolysin secretion/activation protein [Microcoleaceae cyanobacterium]
MARCLYLPGWQYRVMIWGSMLLTVGWASPSLGETHGTQRLKQISESLQPLNPEISLRKLEKLTVVSSQDSSQGSVVEMSLDKTTRLSKVLPEVSTRISVEDLPQDSPQDAGVKAPLKPTPLDLTIRLPKAASKTSSQGSVAGFEVGSVGETPACTLIRCQFLAQALPPGPVNPQPDPNRDRFIPIPRPQPAPPSQPELEPKPPETPQPPPDANVPIPVQKVEVTGSSILTPEEIRTLVSPLENRSVTLKELQEVADKITELYLEQGYITSRAIVPEQTVTDGTVEIQVIEGSLEDIRVEGTQRLNPSYIQSRVRLGAGTPLSTARLEDQLRLLRLDPLFDNVEASLRAGTQEGQSILVVRVIEADAFQLGFSIDNYSPPSIGSERLGISLRHLNLTGNGDFFYIAYNTTRLITDGESDVVDFFYSIPINAMNGTIQLRIPPYRNRIVAEDFDPLNIEGESQRYELSYRQPLIRTPREEFALSIGFAYQQSQTFFDETGFGFGSGPDEDGITRTSVFKFGQDYLRRDRDGAWALRSQFSLGTGLFDATNTSQLPNAEFFSWLGQVQRVQRLGENNLLIIQGDIQLSADALFPSQQFVIGGALSLRGYRQNVRAGDNGFRFSIEDRITLVRDDEDEPKLQLAPFVDLGAVWNQGDNPNTLFGQTFLAGVGLGVLWEPIQNLNVRLDYGLPLVDIDDRGDNLQDDGLYFSINFGF